MHSTAQTEAQQTFSTQIAYYTNYVHVHVGESNVSYMMYQVGSLNHSETAQHTAAISGYFMK